MNRLTSTALIGLALGLGFVGVAHANVTDIRKADNALEIDVGAGHLKYGETSTGEPAGYTPGTPGVALDTETAWMPAFGGHASMLTSSKKYSYLNDLYLSLDLNALAGKTDYRGHYQGVSFTPAYVTDHANIYTISGQLGKAIPLGKYVMLTPLVDLGWRYWARGISGGSEEDYQHAEFLGGMMLQYSPFARWVFSLTGEAGTTFGARMTSNSGDTYDLGSTTVYKFNGKIGYTFSKRFEITTSVGFKGFGYGISQTLPDTSLEPNSYTHEMTTMVGLAYHLSR